MGEYDALDSFLKEHNKIEFSGSMRHLMHYPFDVGLRMVEIKQRFVSFLLSLQNMTFKDYSLLESHSSHSEEYLNLFYEWALNNSIFSEKELNYCPKLRSNRFLSVLKYFKRDGGSKLFLIPYVIAYQATR